MRGIRKVAAIFILTALVIASLPVRTLAASDISDEEAAVLVKSAIEKYKKHETVLEVMRGLQTWELYAYDSVHDIGAYLFEGYGSYREASLDDEDVSWIDFKKKLIFDCYKGIPLVLPADKYIIDRYKYYFNEITDSLENGFPVADEYRYAGMIWNYGPGGEQHLCYRIEVPEYDASLYLDGENFLPKCIYIGVDDNEIYRIDEERYYDSEMETFIHRYYTFFRYPDKLSIPDSIVKNAVLDDDYEFEQGGVIYSPWWSVNDEKKMALCANDWEEDKTKHIKIISSKKILGKCYKVERILSYCFYEDKYVESVSVPDSVIIIGEGAFCYCKNLKKVTIGKGIKKIEARAFQGCKKLKTIVIKNKKMRKYANSKKGRKELRIGKNVKIKAS